MLEACMFEDIQGSSAECEHDQSELWLLEKNEKEMEGKLNLKLYSTLK